MSQKKKENVDNEYDQEEEDTESDVNDMRSYRSFDNSSILSMELSDVSKICAINIIIQKVVISTKNIQQKLLSSLWARVFINHMF